MPHSLWRVIAAAVVATLVAACSAPADEPAEGAGGAPGSRPGWPAPDQSSGPDWPVLGQRWPRADAAAPVPPLIDWPEGFGAPLRPIGLDLVGGTGEHTLVVDGGGAVWVHGPWQVARVDPWTGDAAVWDAEDDAAFSQFESLAPSAGSGAWLVSADRVRLFDGGRFVVDLPVPAEYRGGSGVRAMVERGAEVWIGTDMGVARWAQGRWEVVGLGQVSEVVTLAVDGAGTVWVSGLIATGRGPVRGVAVFDGRRWVVPAEASAPLGHVDEIEVDPTGGVVVRFGSLRPRLYRFESDTWIDLTAGLADTRAGELGPDAVAVAPDGRIWVAGSTGITSRGRYGAWEAEVMPGWLEAIPDQPVLSGLAHVAGALVAADRRGLVRLEEASLDRVWTDPALPGGDVTWEGELSPWLIAWSADEAWVDYRPPGSWWPVVVHRTAQGWSSTDPPTTEYHLASYPVRATDGALWQTTDAGLARYDGQRWRVVDTALVRDGVGVDLWWRVASPFGGLPGPDGSFWVASSEEARSVVEVRPDGARRSVDLPEGAQADAVRAVAGSGREFWALIQGVGAVPRRGDQWGDPVPLPAGMAVAFEAAIGGEGALWATLLPVASDREQVLARLEDGRWQVLEEEVVGLARAEVGVCGIRGREYWGWGPMEIDSPGRIACFDGEGLTEEVVLPVEADTAAVAPDGGVWVVGEQLARLPGRVGRAGSVVS